MKISEYQELVDKWIQKYGVRYFDEKTNMLILMEEVGELSRLMSRKFGEQSFKNSELSAKAEDSIKDELADIYFVLTCLANQMQIDMEAALVRNMEKKTSRDQMRHTENKKLRT